MSAAIPATHIRIKRAYEAPVPADGRRVLIDRLWPRGVRKDELKLDGWEKDLAPSNELRHWFGHDPTLWDGFRQRYAAELVEHADALKHLRTVARQGVLTLVYGAHDEAHNNAVALREFLLDDQAMAQAAASAPAKNERITP